MASAWRVMGILSADQGGVGTQLGRMGAQPWPCPGKSPLCCCVTRNSSLTSLGLLSLNCKRRVRVRVVSLFWTAEMDLQWWLFMGVHSPLQPGLWGRCIGFSSLWWQILKVWGALLESW